MMFSKQDYEEYFRLIEIKEHAMLHFLTDTISRIQDAEIIGVLKQMLKEEAEHYGVSQKLLDFVKNIED
jgi:hypothetical protein